MTPTEEDVARAEALLTSVGEFFLTFNGGQLVRIVSRLIAETREAERARCMRIVESYGKADEISEHISAEIAAAIRTPDKEPRT